MIRAKHRPLALLVAFVVTLWMLVVPHATALARDDDNLTVSATVSGEPNGP